MLIPNPYLDFWNSDPKIHSWASLDRKSQSCPFCKKIGKHGISRMLILIPTLVFWIPNLNSFWANLGQNSQNCPFGLKTGTQSISRMSILIPTFVFRNSKPKSIFWTNFSSKKLNCIVCLEAETHSVLSMWLQGYRGREEHLEVKIKMNNCIKYLLVGLLFLS